MPTLIDIAAPSVVLFFTLATFATMLEAINLNHLLLVTMSLTVSDDTPLVDKAAAAGGSRNTSSSPALSLRSEAQMVPFGCLVGISILLVLGVLVSAINIIDMWPLVFVDKNWEKQQQQQQQQQGAQTRRNKRNGGVVDDKEEGGDSENVIAVATSVWKSTSKRAQIIGNILFSGGSACLALLSLSTMLSWTALDRGFPSPAETQSVVSFWVLALILFPMQLFAHFRVAPTTRKITRLRLLISKQRQPRLVGPRRANNNNNVDDDDAGDGDGDEDFEERYHYREEYNNDEELDEETVREERSTISAMLRLFSGSAEYEHRIFTLSKWVGFSVGMLSCICSVVALVTLAVAFAQGLFESPVVVSDDAATTGKAASADNSSYSSTTTANASSLATAAAAVVDVVSVKRISTGLVCQFCIVCGIGAIVGLFNALEWVLLDTTSEQLEVKYSEKEEVRRQELGKRRKDDDPDDDHQHHGSIREPYSSNNNNNNNNSVPAVGSLYYDRDEEGRSHYYLCGWLGRCHLFDCYAHVVIALFCIKTPLRKRVQIFVNGFLAGAHFLSICIVIVTLVTSIIAKSRPVGFENDNIVIVFWVFLALAAAMHFLSWALVPMFLMSRLLVELKNHEDERREGQEQAARHRQLRDADFSTVLAGEAQLPGQGARPAEHSSTSSSSFVRFDPRDANHLFCDIPAGRQFLDSWRPKNHILPRKQTACAHDNDDDDDYDDDKDSDDQDEEELAAVAIDGGAGEATANDGRRRENCSERKKKKKTNKNDMRPEDLEVMELRRLQRVRASVARSLSNLRHINPEQARHWATLSDRAQRWKKSSGFIFWQRFEKVLAHVAARRLLTRNNNDNNKSNDTNADNEKLKKLKQKRIRNRTRFASSSVSLAYLLGNFHSFRVMSSAPTTTTAAIDEEDEDEDEAENVSNNNNNNKQQQSAAADRALLFPPCTRLVSCMTLLSASTDTVPLLFSRFYCDENNRLNSAQHIRRGLYSVQLCLSGVWRRAHLDSLVPVQPPEHVAELGALRHHDEEEQSHRSSANSCSRLLCCSDDNATSSSSSSKHDSSALRRLLAPHCRNGIADLFPLLIHKAAAKLLGSFAAVSTELGDALDEIHDLSGAPIERFLSWSHYTSNSSNSNNDNIITAATSAAFVQIEDALLRFDGRADDMELYPLVLMTCKRFFSSSPPLSSSSGKKNNNSSNRWTPYSVEQLVAPASKGGSGFCDGVPKRVLAAVSCPRDAAKAAALVNDIKRYRRKRINLAAWSAPRDGLDNEEDTEDERELEAMFRESIVMNGTVNNNNNNNSNSNTKKSATEQQQQQQPSRRPVSPVLDMPLDDDDVNFNNKNDISEAEQKQPEQLQQQQAEGVQDIDQPLRFVMLQDDGVLNNAETEFAALRRVIDRSLFPDSHLRRLIAAAAACHDRKGVFTGTMNSDDDDDRDDQRQRAKIDESGVDPYSTIVPLTRPLPLVGFGAFNNLVLSVSSSSSSSSSRNNNKNNSNGRSSDDAATAMMKESATFLCRDAIATHVMRNGLCIADDLSVCTFADACMIAKIIFLEWTEATERVFCRAGVAHVPVTGFLDDIAQVHVSLAEENGIVDHAAREAVRYHRTRFMLLKYAHERKMRKRRNNNNNNTGTNHTTTTTTNTSAMISRTASGLRSSSPNRTLVLDRSRSPSPLNPAMNRLSATATATTAAVAESFSSFSGIFLDGSTASMSISMSPSALYHRAASASELFFQQNPHLERKWIDQEMATFVGIASRTPSFAARSLPLMSPLTDIRLPNRFHDFGATSDWIMKVNVVCPPAAATIDGDDGDDDDASTTTTTAAAAEQQESPVRRRNRTTTTIFIGLHQPDARNVVASLLADGECCSSGSTSSSRATTTAATTTTLLPACGCTYHPCMLSVIHVPKPGAATTTTTTTTQTVEEVAATLVVTAEKQSNNNSFSSDRDVYLRVELTGSPGAGEDYLVIPRMQALHQHLFYLSEKEEQQMERMNKESRREKERREQQLQQAQVQQQQRVMMTRQQQRQQQSPTRQQQQRQRQQERSGSRPTSPNAPSSRNNNNNNSSNNTATFEAEAANRRNDKNNNRMNAAAAAAAAAEGKTHTVHNRDGSTYTIALEPQITMFESPSTSTVVERKCYQVWQTVMSKQALRQQQQGGATTTTTTATTTTTTTGRAPSSLIPRRQVLLNTTTTSAAFVLSMLVPKKRPFQLAGLRAGDYLVPPFVDNDGDDDGNESCVGKSGNSSRNNECSISVTLIRPSAKLVTEIRAKCESPLEQLANRLSYLPEPQVVAAMAEEAKLSILTVSLDAVMETMASAAGASSSSSFSMEQYLSRATSGNKKQHFFVEQLLSDVPASVAAGRVPLAQVDSETLF